jgi:hypothetical protein
VPGDLSWLSCATPSVCFAVSLGGPPSQFGVIRIVDGGAASHPTPINENFYIDGISCPSPAGCALLDWGPPTYRPEVVRVSLGGALGSPRHLGGLAKAADLDHIACYPTRTNCTLVGHGKRTINVVSVDGRAAVRHDLSLPASVVVVSIDAVACPSPSRCFAVGQASTHGTHNDNGLVVPIRDGVPRRAIYIPSASGGGLIAIACPSLRTCYAIGFSARHTVLYTLHSGRVTHAAYFTKLIDLEGIACESIHLCYAVGSDGRKGAVVPIRDGRRGKVQTTSVTPRYGTGLNPGAIAAFATGIDIAGLDRGHPQDTVISSS